MSTIRGERLNFGQKKHDDVDLVVYGDEFYARYETPDGYTVVFDRDLGRYCYAALSEGAFVSTGVSLEEAVPNGVGRHLKEDTEVRHDRFWDRYTRLRPKDPPPTSGVYRTYGAKSGLLPGHRIAKGKVKGLTLLVQFEDETTSITAEQVDAMLNDLDYNANGNFCSVRKYYRLMSSDGLDYTNRVVGPITLSRPKSYYIDHLLVEEALDLAVANHGVDLADYDSSGRDTVDALSVLYAGRTQYNGELWPHNSVLQRKYGHTRTHFYTIQSMGRRPVDLSIGTFVHESGHMLMRFPDLYDYGTRDGDHEDSSGLGYYCLMSSGNHNGGGKIPSPVCAYLRDLAGWCDQEILLNTAGHHVARHGAYNTVMRFYTDRPNEYFLVENRSQLWLDTKLPASGLAIYHCDIKGSNEWQAGTPAKHYQAALLQADGRNDLETNPHNTGDSDDLFDSTQGVALSYETNPSTKTWSGSDSGLVLSDIECQGEVIAFNTGAVGARTTLTRRVTPDALIPDDNDDGVQSRMRVPESGRVAKLRILVDITHSYRGDLEIQLVSPQAKEVTLHRKKVDPYQDLQLDLSTPDHEELAKLEGQEISGEWTLSVKDLWKDDVGRLNFWELQFELQE